jgi:light-regulated signal transduction histidine kinase (bacteriophytochrome)
VRKLFPKDTVLQDMVAESYIGTTLWGSKGQPIGLIAIIGRQPLTDPKLAESMLKLVSIRASGELERRQTDNEIKELNEKLNNQVVELNAANKELESFSYAVSHDLRAPLRHLLGFTAMLQKKYEGQLDERARHYTTTIISAARKMEILIDDLLVFSRMGRLDMRMGTVKFNTLVRESVRAIQHELKGRDITWEIDKLPDVYGDKSMLSLVLINLISNAVKFTSTRPQAEIRIGCEADGNEFVFSVKDNGVGFDMKHADRLFEAFQRLHTQNEFEGTGIGLANIRRIISRHGGQTWAEGTVGRGAVFYFTLPKTKEL